MRSLALKTHLKFAPMEATGVVDQIMLIQGEHGNA